MADVPDVSSKEKMEKYLGVAFASGMPADQIKNFFRFSYVPQERQMLFHAAARMADEEEGPDQVGYGGARGGGKSKCIFSQIALDDCQRYPGIKVLYLRKAAKQAKEQFEDLRRDVLGENGEKVPHEYKRQEGVVRFPNGSRILIGHFKDEKDVDNYLGLEYDIIVIEEATSLSSTKYQALRDSNRSGKDGWRPRMYSSTNPGNIGHVWYKKRYVEPYRNAEEKWTRFIPATLDDNAFVDSGYERRVNENTGWRLRAYRYGDWDVAVGQYFVTWSHKHHVVRPDEVLENPSEIPDHWDVWAAMDYGYAHPTVIYLLARDSDGFTYVVDEHWMQRQLPHKHADGYFNMLKRWNINPDLIWPFKAGRDVFAPKVIDRGKGTMNTVADRYGELDIYLEGANMDRVNGAGRLLELLGDPENDVDPRIAIFQNCPHLIECIPAMQHNPNHTDDVKKWDVDEHGLGGDDAYDCLRYGLMAENVGSRPSYMIEPTDVLAEYDSSSWAHERYEPVSRNTMEAEELYDVV